jgi:hypothetical protein
MDAPDPIEAKSQLQRIHVAVENHQSKAKRVKITVEAFDEGLGWYTAGSLSLPLHQLPLLEQALQEIPCRKCADLICPSNIIPFPGLAKAFEE